MAAKTSLGTSRTYDTILNLLRESGDSSLLFPISLSIPPFVEASESLLPRLNTLLEADHNLKLEDGIAILPRYRGLEVNIVKSGEDFFITDGETVYESNFLSGFAERYLDDFVLHAIISSFDGNDFATAEEVAGILESGSGVDKLSFNIYDLVSARGVDYTKTTWEARQVRLKEMRFSGGVTLVKPRVAYEEAAFQTSAESILKRDGVESLFVISVSHKGNVMAEGINNLDVKIYKIVEGESQIGSLLALSDGEKLSRGFAFPFVEGIDEPLPDFGPTSVMILEDVLELPEGQSIELVTEGKGMVSRWREDNFADESKRLYEFALNMPEHPGLNGLWSISETAASDYDDMDAMIYKLGTLTPFHLREAKSKGRKAEVDSLPEWQKPGADALAIFCNLANTGKEQISVTLSESDTKRGTAWGVTIIEAGTSLNGNHWSAGTLKKHVSIFEGMPVNYIELQPETPNHMSIGTRKMLDAHPVKHTIGAIVNARWNNETEAIDGDMVIFADQFSEDVRKKLVSAYEAGIKMFGLSVDVEAMWHSDTIEGREVRYVDEILDVNAWVDIVANPSAGGSINKILESINEGESRMDINFIANLLKTFGFSESQVEGITSKLNPEKLAESFTSEVLAEIQNQQKSNLDVLVQESLKPALDEATTLDAFKERYPNYSFSEVTEEKEDKEPEVKVDNKQTNEDGVVESRLAALEKQNEELQTKLAESASRENLREALDNSGLNVKVQAALFESNSNKLFSKDEAKAFVESQVNLFKIVESMDEVEVKDNGKQDVQTVTEELTPEQKAKKEKVAQILSGK